MRHIWWLCCQSMDSSHAESSVLKSFANICCAIIASLCVSLRTFLSPVSNRAVLQIYGSTFYLLYFSLQYHDNIMFVFLTHSHTYISISMTMKVRFKSAIVSVWKCFLKGQRSNSPLFLLEVKCQ